MILKLTVPTVVLFASTVFSLYTSTTPAVKKAGLAYPKETTCLKLFSKKFRWGHNWEGVRGVLSKDIEFVPTCRGGPQAALCKAIEIAADTRYILGPNEPHIASQDSYGPNGWFELANYYYSTVTPLKAKCKNGCQLLSPSFTNTPNSEGLIYLKKFLDACGPKCQISRLCLHWHWFGPLTADGYYEQFVTYMETAHKMFPNQIFWINEFSAQQGTVDDIAKFVTRITKWLDACSYIERYAYYIAAPGDATSGALVSPDGSHLNEVGVQYNL